FDGTMHLEADLDVPDALGLAEAVSAGAARLAALGSEDTLDGRRATALGDLARHQLAFGFDDAESGPREVTKPATTQIVLHAHLSADAILRTNPDGDKCLSGYVEQAGHRVLTSDQIRDWCGRPDVSVVVKPVLDLHHRLETTGYTPTDRIRDHVIARDRTCVFPWCGRNARRCDLDHVAPFDHTDPTRGGPTSTDNLAPLCRRHHRLKTKGRWRYRMTDPGCSSGPAPWVTSSSATTPAPDRSTPKAPPSAPPNHRASTEPTSPATRPTIDHTAPHPAQPKRGAAGTPRRPSRRHAWSRRAPGVRGRLGGGQSRDPGL
ncbi:HNH endonuclease signature motif containing protein, partial [Nocardioides sp.]|uniref:HNH endonuclease signature motif containing protein n=1 Tax=Nocardioides sp. TaxID=35761 RepID=UPI002C84319A